jgi:hypothetical protein
MRTRLNLNRGVAALERARQTLRRTTTRHCIQADFSRALTNAATVVSALILALELASPTQASGQAAPEVSVPLRWNVTAAGAVAGERTDCTAAFQKALDEAGRAGGGVVEAPAGRYRINGNLRVPAHVTLQGVFRSAPNPAHLGSTNVTGTVLLAYAGRGSTNGPAFIRLAGHNAGIAGVIIEYPEWKRSDVPPVPYPPCVASQDTENVAIQDCCLLNPYEAIKLVRAARHLVRNVTGYPIWRGLFVDECYDIGRVENVHFWPFGLAYNQDDPYCKWINTQGVAFEFARTDWHYVANTFCFGYGIGYRFSESKNGSANGNFLGLGADSCERAVVVEQAQPPGLLISNGEFVGRWGSTNAVCLEIAPQAEGKVSLANCSFWGPIDRCVWMRSPVGQFTASACNFVHWDNRGAGSAAIQIDAGRAIVQGCTFAQDGVAVAVASEVTSAILSGNQAAGGFRVENAAGDRTQMALNEPDPISWTPEARAHYRLTVGASGDGRYVQGFHGAERSDRPFRWSIGNARLILPVVPGKAATITIEFSAPKHALADDSGLYLDGKLLATFSKGNTVAATLPAATTDRVRLDLRAQGWIPQRVVPGSKDPRTLGVQLFGITVKSEGAGLAVFDANTGRPTRSR